MWVMLDENENKVSPIKSNLQFLLSIPTAPSWQGRPLPIQHTFCVRPNPDKKSDIYTAILFLLLIFQSLEEQFNLSNSPWTHLPRQHLVQLLATSAGIKN
jgi:hypothetical protein